MPKSGGAGFSDRVTLLPECRPIPEQETGRRRVRCDCMDLLLGPGKPLIAQQSGCHQGSSPLGPAKPSIFYELLIAIDGNAKTANTKLWLRSHRTAGQNCGYFTTAHFYAAVKISARNCPVNDSRLRATASGVPCATMRPPAEPPSGPRSMT